MSSWGAGVDINLNTIIKATTQQYSGFHFKCTTAGTTGSSEPIWPTNIGNQVTDGTVVWTAVSSVYDATNTLEPDPYIELFELVPIQELHNTSIPIRWHNGTNEGITANIEFNGLTYSRLAIEATGFESTTTGATPRPKLKISNIDSTITMTLNQINLFNNGSDLTGAILKRIKTAKRFIDNQSAADPTAVIPYEVWYIDRKESENFNMVIFELGHIFDKPNEFVPKRQLIGNCCQWIYRSSECSYTGSNYFNKTDGNETLLANDVCGKRLSSCKKRFGENGVLPFGSFPAAGKTQ